jgi:hypothetical protein
MNLKCKKQEDRVKIGPDSFTSFERFGTGSKPAIFKIYSCSDQEFFDFFHK